MGSVCLKCLQSQHGYTQCIQCQYKQYAKVHTMKYSQVHQVHLYNTEIHTYTWNCNMT